MRASVVSASLRIELGTSKLTIGRAPNNQLMLPDTHVSGYHAEIRPEGEEYLLIDLGSRNGTFVNDYRLTPNVPRTLNPNDILRFGQRVDNPHFQFTYTVEGALPVEPTDPGLSPSPIHSPYPQQQYQQTLPSTLPYQQPRQVRPMNAWQRPSIWDIVSGHADYTPVPGISEEERAIIVGQITGVSAGNFYFGLKAGQGLGKALGIKSTHHLQAIFPAPYQYTAVVLACVLASRFKQREIVSMNDTPTGSMVQLRMAAEMWSSGGMLMITIIDESPSRIVVLGESEIQGSMTDWGKGRNALEELFRATDGYLHRLSGY